MKFNWLQLVSTLLLVELIGPPVTTFASTFEERRQEYFNDVLYGEWGQKEPYQRNSLWAYLEMPDPIPAEIQERIHVIVRAMVLSYLIVMPELWSDRSVGWFKSVHIDNSLVMRLFLQYPNKISQEDYDWLHQRFREQIINDNQFLVAENGNQKINQIVGLYLYTYYFDRTSEITYYRASLMGSQWKSFSINGHSYQVGAGNRYNAYQFAKDYLEYLMYLYVFAQTNSGSTPLELWEFDGMYVHSYLTPMIILYDFAEGDMKRKAKMVTDFLILEYYADFSASQHGGREGRSGGPGIPNLDYYLLGVGWVHPAFPSRDVFVSTYRMPDLLSDILDMTDEADGYSQFTTEYNSRLHTPGKGKYTYLNKYFNLGGGWRWSWEMNMAKNPVDIYTSQALWFNNQEEDPDGGAYAFGGEFFASHNIAWYDGDYLHYWGTWDATHTIGYWRFYKYGKVMIATNGSGLEVCIEGSDYPSFTAFKQAVAANAHSGYYSFTDSKGNTVSFNPNNEKGYYNGIEVATPFDRIEITDNLGAKIVSWDNRVMTMTKNGRQTIYDFNNWTYTDVALDATPPLPPVNLVCTFRTKNSLSIEWSTPGEAADGDYPVQYKILRNSVLMGQGTNTNFTDNGLADSTLYAYQIYSIDDAGNLSAQPLSGSFYTLANHLALSLVKVVTHSPTVIDVIFNKDVEKVSAETASNYTVTPNVTVLSAILKEDSKAVRLKTTQHSPSVSYELAVDNVREALIPSRMIEADARTAYVLGYMLKVQNLSRAGYDTTRAVVGASVFSDRNFTINNLSPALVNALLIKTKNDDKLITGDSFLSFQMSKPATIYVAYDYRIASLPAWLQSWTAESGLSLSTTDTSYRIYRKSLEAGDVVLGANYGIASSSMYCVLIQKTLEDINAPQAPHSIILSDIVSP